MIIIDADKFLTYLIFSKHIDGLTCGEVKEAIEMSKVNVFDKIKAEKEDIAFDWQEIDGEHESFMVVDSNDVLQIIDKYKAENEGEG